MCVGHASAVAGRGAFLTVELAGESLLFIGDGDGNARGFFNVCRHRGSRLITEPEGSTRRLQCPYHAWTYGFDGSLRNAPHTEELQDFDPACNGLRQVRTESPAGCCSATSRARRRRSPSTSERSPSTSTRTAPPPAARRPDRLRRRRELEGDRRELLRVPALPRRAPGAEPPQPLPQRRRHRRAGGVVRRLDDPDRGRGDDGHQRRRPGPPADRGRRPARGPVLRDLPELPGVAAPRLRDAAHAVAARRRPHRGRVRVVLRARDDASARASTAPTRSSSGTSSTARTGRCAS